MRWTEEQLMEYLRKRGSKNILQPKKKNKYNNKKVIVDGIKFDSKMEAKYYYLLKLLQEAGEVKAFELQPKFTLQEGFKKNGKRYQPITYTADFRVEYADGHTEIVDVKGVETQVFKIKKKMFEYHYPDLELKIVKEV